MQSGRSRVRDPYLTAGDQHMKGLSQAWNQLGRARKELRRMEHRLGDPAHLGSAECEGDGASRVPDGKTPALTAPPRDHIHVLDPRSQPTARFVEASRPSSSPCRQSGSAAGSSGGSGTKRKVSRLDEKDRPSSSSATASQQRYNHNHNHRHHPHPQDQQARVAGSSCSQQFHSAWLDPREHPAPFSSSTQPPRSNHQHNHQHNHHPHNQHNHSPKRVDFSKRLRLREVRWDGTYQDSVAHKTRPEPLADPYPSSIISSDPHGDPDRDGDPAGSSSTLTDSRAVRETEIRFLNDTYLTQPLLHHPHPHPHPKLTQVDVDVPGSRSKVGVKDRGVARHTGHGGRRDPGQDVRTRTLQGASSVPGDRMNSAADMGDHSSGGDSDRGAVGGAERPPRGGTNSRLHKIKKSLKDLPDKDDILSQLREKIKQQRQSASSTDTSHNDSLASSQGQSDTAGGATPRHALHDAHDPVRRGAEGDVDLVPEKLPRTRKVAAGPALPSYKGFSETHMDPGLQATVKKVNRLSAPRNKKSAGGGGGAKATTTTSTPSPDPVHTAIQTQLKAHGHHPLPHSSVQPSSTSTPNTKAYRKTLVRVVAPGGGAKACKSGAKNVITTSSWRAGQELVARELGLPKAKSREDTRRGGSSGPPEDTRRPDGAEGNTSNSARMPATGADNAGKPSTSGKDYSAQLAQSRALSEDAKKLFSDLQLENQERTPSSRPGVKRKAPKEREAAAEKREPVEKQRHYDTESVRQFMARQKAERQRHREKVRREEEQDRVKRQQLMQELITKQRSAAAVSYSKAKKVKRVGKGRQTVLFPPDQHNMAAYDQRIRSLLGEESDKENEEGQGGMEEDDNSDGDTLTGESEGSTPRPTSHNPREEAPDRGVAAFHPTSEHKFGAHTDPHLPTTSATGAGGLTSAPTSSLAPSSAARPIQFQGRKLNLDVDTVLSRFSQVCSQRHGQGAGGGGRGEGGSAERSRQDRLQELKDSSKTLKTKIASTSVEMRRGAEVHPNPPSQDNSEADFVPRYDRIAGSRDDFRVFTSNLPGAQTSMTAAKAGNTEKTPVAGVRASLQSQPESVSNAAPRSFPLTPGAFHQGVDDDDSVTETSTFSEVTAAVDDWETHPPTQKGGEAVARQTVAQRTEGRADSTAQYTAPTAGSSLRWEDPHSDPYSVLNIFSRQHRHGVRVGEGSGSRQREPTSQTSGTVRLKDPTLVAASQQVTLGRSVEGHPVKVTSTYTRMEATLPDSSQASQLSASVSRNRTARSEKKSERVSHSSLPSRARSMSEDTQSLESEEEEDGPLAASSRHLSRKSGASFRRQMSDTGQETDVSQLSEDEPRVSARSYGGPIADRSQQEGGEARWSPAALERQMTAELARLESLEDSIRQLSSAERTRAVALAQQETVSVAQVLKARQQAHSAELRSLQQQVQEERLASAQQLQQQLIHSKAVQAPASDMASLHAPPVTGSRQLLEKAENRRPETKVTTSSVTRSRGRDDTEYTETFTSLHDTRPSAGHAASPAPSSRSRSSPSLKTAEDSSTAVKTARDSSTTVRTAEDSATSVRTAEDYTTSVKTAEDTESIKTAEDSQAESDYSIKTASDSEAPGADASGAAEEVPDGDYSLSFEESATEDRSVKKRPSRDAKNRKSASKTPVSEERSSLRVADLTSIYGGEDSFNRFTMDIVRNIMREEEVRAQYQESLLRIRAKALKEKTRAQLSLVRQERQQWLEKGQGDSTSHTAHRELKRLADREKAILKEQAEHKAEIDRMFKTEQLAREHRHSLLKQHEQIAKMQAETREKMQQLQGRLGQPAEGHTEDDTSMVEDLSDASDISYAKDSKSDSEMTQRKAKYKGDKQKMEKQQKIRLDQKYLTVREQKLMERRKQASELLRWKQDLDAEEQKVLQLERSALQAWEGRVSHKASPPDKTDPPAQRDKDGDRQPDQVERKGNLRAEVASRPEKVSTPRTARTDPASTPRSAVDSYTPFSQSEAVSTHITASASDKKSPTDSSTRSRAPGTRSSETSIAEDVADGSEVPTQLESSPDRRVDSSDDTIINSSVNEEEEAESRSKGKKSPVETQSDVSDYEVRIRQLSDMLRRRRKEADMLKKERSRRMKEKLRAQEESLKKQVEAYEMYIAQVKQEQQDLEQEGSKPTVPPKIKQPGPNTAKTRTSPSSSPSPSRGHRSPTERSPNYSSSFDGTDSNLHSPALSEDSRVLSPLDKGGKKSTPSSLMERISEGSEASEPSGQGARKGGDRTTVSVSQASSLSEAIEEAADSGSAASDSSPSAILNIQTSRPAKADSENSGAREEENKKGASVAEDVSYSQDFSEAVSQSLAHSHSRLQASEASGRAAAKSEVSEVIESAVSVSTAKSDSSGAPRFDLKGPSPAEKDKEGSVSTSSRPATGIQESDSESESRLNSHRTPSRPSSERSTGSTTYSDFHDLDQEEEDVISSESDRTPVKVSAPPRDRSQDHSQDRSQDRSHGVRTEEDISEHISVSLPSISEKKSSVSQATALGHQNSIDAVLGDLLGDDDATPTHTPRALSPALHQEDAPDPLLMTDPLADFHEGDPVLVWGRVPATLRFKGVVTFAPGHWAGVELRTAKGDMDGERDGHRYFSCPPLHGLLVPGSDISALEEEEGADGKGGREGSEARSAEESLTEQDVSSATEESVVEEAKREEEEVKMEEEEEGGEVREERHNLALLADDITADLTRSLVEDSMTAISTIATRQSSPRQDRTPPPTLPKPTPTSPRDKMPPPTQPKPTSPQDKTPPPTLPKPTSPQDKTPPPTLPKPTSPLEKTPPPTLPKPHREEEVTADSPVSSPKSPTSPELKTPPSTLPKPQKPPEKTPPPTLPKPQTSPEKSSPTAVPEPQTAADKTPPPTLLKLHTSPEEKTPPATLPKPKVPWEDDSEEKEEEEEEKEGKVQKVTTSMVDGLLKDAISQMMHIRRKGQRGEESSSLSSSSLINGVSDDSGVDPSHDSSLDRALQASPEPETGGEEMKRPMSPEPFQRPKSPVPVNSPSQEEEEEDEYDFSGLMGDSQDFFDEDFGLSAKQQLPLSPGLKAGSGTAGESPRPAPSAAPVADVYIVPHERGEVEAIVTDAVSVFWNLRRCGESWESVTPPADFLQESGSADGAGEPMEGMVSASRRTFRSLIFDLTGDIVRDIYRHEHDTDPPPPWQRPAPRRQRYYKGASPPSTLDGLVPVVQGAVTDILGVAGCSGRFRGRSSNKWNVRKKKDHVDALLVEELREEEADWINYDADELAVKMQLTDTIFQSLLDDAVTTLNKVYTSKLRRLSHTS
ncbi:centrosome-associated protein 350-like isoform X2 [Babylonia areolata]|uniref:centrosome-associated protein 350-like isoform X2 n=1 Tax=Babylonia areolata TaxID=304850 RepID=UPI003FD1485C